MAFNPAEFVNRETTLDAFTRLLVAPRCRAMFVYGDPGIGKTSILQRLRVECRRQSVVTALVDFRGRAADAAMAISVLYRELGSPFDRTLDEAEGESGAPEGGAIAELPWGTLVGSASNGVQIGVQEGTLSISGDVVGGHKVILNQPIFNLDPAQGAALRRAREERRRNRALRAGLRAASAAKPVVLFFDHLDEGSAECLRWLREELLSLCIDEAPEKLWIVLAARKLPFVSEIEQWGASVHREPLDPLKPDAVRLFWVERRGLDPEGLPHIQRASLGNPGMLFLMANNYSLALERPLNRA